MFYKVCLICNVLGDVVVVEVVVWIMYYVWVFILVIICLNVVVGFGLKYKGKVFWFYYWGWICIYIIFIDKFDEDIGVKLCFFFRVDCCGILVFIFYVCCCIVSVGDLFGDFGDLVFNEVLYSWMKIVGIVCDLDIVWDNIIGIVCMNFGYIYNGGFLWVYIVWYNGL